MLRKHGSDLVHVLEDGFVHLRTRAGEIIAGRSLLSDLDKPVVEVKGWVELCLRERGKIVPGSRREGFNIWTNTGREYLAMLMSLESSGTAFRTDSVAYIGVGTGGFVEEASVLNLQTPIPYSGSLFLAGLDVPPSFPLAPTRTTVQFHRIFVEDEITTVSGAGIPPVMVSELGLFTNGAQGTGYAPGTRDTSMENAPAQNPCAYKSFEPVGKTNALQLEVSWQIRY